MLNAEMLKEEGWGVAALLRRAAKVRKAALVAAIPGEAGLRVDDLTYKRLAKRWQRLMDAAVALSDSQRFSVSAFSKDGGAR